MKKLFLIIIICLIASLAFASIQFLNGNSFKIGGRHGGINTYAPGKIHRIYIDSGTDASGTGTIGDPYDEFSDLNDTTIANYIAAGTKVYINLQGTFTSRFEFETTGTTNARIKLQGYGTGVTFNVAADYAILAIEHAYIDISNITISSALERGIYLAGTNTTTREITISNVNISNITTLDTTAANGIDFRGTGVTINNCTIHTIGDDGIYGDGDDAEIYSNNIYNCSVDGRGDAIQLGGDNHIVRDNTLDLSDGLFPKHCVVVNGDNATVKYNDCTGNQTGVSADNTQSHIIYVYGAGNEVYGNDLNGGTNGILGGTNIYFNNIINITNRGIVPTYSADFNIINNTVRNVTGEDGIAILIDDGSAITCNIKNNIFTTSDSGFRVIGGGVATVNNDYNNAYDNTNNFVGVTAGANSIETDPDLTAEGKLNTGSPALETGVAISGINDVGTLDIWGNATGTLKNIGAYNGTGE